MARREKDKRSATRILVANTIAVFTMPISIVAFMRRPDTYTSPLFRASVGLVALISLLTATATYAITREAKVE